MKKIINSPECFVADTIDGILCAYGSKLKALDAEKHILLANRNTPKGKVGIVTAGGSGHLPLFLGYVGTGLLDGCAVGNVFASPSAQKMENMIRACDFGGGVLCLYGNYGGDRMNFDMACEAVDFDGIAVRQVLVTDDIASSPKHTAEKRRGVAGMVYAFKLAGAAAEQLLSLDEVAGVAQKAVSNVRSIGFATQPCTLPEVGKPTFSICEDEIEVGMGIHGEPGIEMRKMMSAEEIAGLALEKITEDMALAHGDEVSVMINGLGSTPLEELLIVYRSVHRILEGMGVQIVMPHIGEFATSMEMAGLSITIQKLDGQLKTLLTAPASSPFYTNHNK